MIEFDDRENVKRAVQNLDGIQRFVVARKMLGWTDREIAEARAVFGETVTRSAIQQTYARGLRNLRRELGSRYA